MSDDPDYDERIPREPVMDLRTRTRRIAMIAVPLLIPVLAVTFFAVFWQPSYPPRLCRTGFMPGKESAIGLEDRELQRLLLEQKFEVHDSVGRENHRYALYEQRTLRCMVTCKIVWRVDPDSRIVEWSEATAQNDCS